MAAKRSGHPAGLARDSSPDRAPTPAERLIASEMPRREFLRAAGAAGVALSFSSVLAACGSGSGSDRDFSSITWGVNGGLQSLNFFTQVSTNALLAQTLCLEGLLYYDSNNKLVPWLAKSWENRDYKRFVFQMRDNVKWHDGKPFTVDDAVFQYQFHLDPDVSNSASGYWQGFVRSVEKTGPSELTIELIEPLTAFPTWLAIGASYVMPRDQIVDGGWESVGTPSTLPIGTGPYKVESLRSNSSASFTYFDDYWGRKPMVRDVTLNVIADDSTRQLALRNGQIDGTFDVPTQNIKVWGDMPNVEMATASSLAQWFMATNVTKAPFDDVHVRRAMAHALNKEGIVESVWGVGAPSVALVPPEFLYELMGKDEVTEFYDSLPSYPYDLDAAAAELKKSKHPDGFSISIQTTKDRPQQALICEIFAASLAKIGIKLEVTAVSDSQWIDVLRNNNPAVIGLTINDYGGTGPDPGPNLALVNPDRAKPHLENYAHYDNPALRQPFVIVDQGGSRAQQIEAIKTILTATAEDVPYLPIGVPDCAVATVGGLEMDKLSGNYNMSPFAPLLKVV